MLANSLPRLLINGDVNLISVLLFFVGAILVIIELFVIGAIIGIIGISLIILSIIMLEITFF